MKLNNKNSTKNQLNFVEFKCFIRIFNR